MAPQLNISATIVEGMRNDFADTYSVIQNRQSDSRLSIVMDMDLQATYRYHIFGQRNAMPHIGFWQRGDTIPIQVTDSIQWRAIVHEWGLRIPWSKFDREDEQLGTLMDDVRQGGESAALLEERMFFNLLTNTTTDLPVVPNAPDGQAFFSTTSDGASAARFGATNGNLLTGTTVTTVHDVQFDYYAAIEQFGLFQDGQGQPLFRPEIIAGGTLIIHAMADTQIFEQSFLQVRQGIGMDAAGARGGTVIAASADTNLVQDASRNVQLWGTPRLATGDWYIFLLNSPKKPTFSLDRKGRLELAALEGDNNSDTLRDTGVESLQWERRVGAGIATPYGAIKINN